MGANSVIVQGLAQTAVEVHEAAAPASESVLLLHGIPGSGATWQRVSQRLAGGHRVIVPDLLGFGKSSDPPGDWHARAQAAQLHGVIRQLGVDACHVVGFDFGGPIAVMLYEQAPALFKSLTLIATNTFTDTPLPGPLKLARHPALGTAMFAALCSWPGLASLWIAAVGDKTAVRYPAFVRDLPDRRGRRWTRRVFQDSLQNLTSRYAPVEAVLSSINCPALVIWGDRDPFFPIAVGERTAAAIPGARFEVLRGCGHFVPLERAEMLATALERHVLHACAHRGAGKSRLAS